MMGSSATVPYPLRPPAADLQSGLRRVVQRLGFADLVQSGRMAIALVDLSRPEHFDSALLNGDRMFYAASLPKIAILLGAFEAIDEGLVRATPWLKQQMTRMIRVSDNAAATAVLDTVGFPTVARTVQATPYLLYTPTLGGGLWVGKAYAQNRYWRRDPVADLSHAATARQAARFFVLLQEGLLVSEEASREMLQMLGDPGVRHKFVRGLESRPGATIYRKSGTWHQYHADAALIVRPDARYVAVGLVADPRGERALRDLIVGLDDLVRERQRGRP